VTVAIILERRRFLKVLGAAGAFGTIFLNGGNARASKKRRPPEDAKIVVLGFDGVEPSLLEQGMAEGAFPNLEKLAKKGTYTYLGSTNPPQSPVAWSSFTTGMHPGDHGIFDFIKRDPATHLPDFALNRIEFPKARLGILPGGQLAAENLRHGNPFWLQAANNGVRVAALHVPYTFPAVILPGGRTLTGLGTPDLRGTNSTFFYYGSDLSGEDETGVSGGRLLRLHVNGDKAESVVPGPPMGSDNGYLSLPIQFERLGGGVRISVSGQQWEVQVGEWSPWTTFEFPVTHLWSIRGMGRFLVLESEPNIRVYLTPIGTDAAHQFVPVSAPEQFAGDIKREVSDFSTVGWVHDTSAVDAGILPDDQFLRQALDVMDFRERLLLSQLEKGDWDLLMSVFTATDRAAHMFYRYLDPLHPRHDPEAVARLGQPLRTVYQKMDSVIGRVMDRLGSDTRLIVLSDHGFHHFRRGFHLNTWLAKNGYLRFRGVSDGFLPNPVPEDSFFPDVDWRKSKAYALGTGAIYINLRGREQWGTVLPGDEANRFLADLRQRLLAEKDPKTGSQVIRQIYFGSEIFQGGSSAQAPDLQIGYADGYRGSVITLLGGFGKSILEDNHDAWSGDHSGSDVQDTSGMLFTNWRLEPGSPSIVDLAPTILDMFGLIPPPSMPGTKLT
jgi:predicted AlkP superfamily phosphohydrolase/phosphomutase